MMKTIHKKIVFDENNKPVEVIINYSEWREIETLLGESTKMMSRKRLGDYAGKVHLKEDPMDFQRRIRSEWK